MSNCALDLVNEFMERKKSEDVSSLLLLSHIYVKTGNCDSAIKSMKKAYDLAEASGEPLLLCLALAKEMCNMWHLKKTDEIEGKLELCESILAEVDEAHIGSAYSSRKNSERLIEVFKTLGYIHGYMYKRSRKSVKYYLRALEILLKDPKSIIRIFQVMIHIIRMYSKHSQQKAQEYCLDLFENIKAVSRNEIFMKRHSLLIVHYLQVLAYTLENADCFNKALELHEFAFDIGKEFSGENHPKVVRHAANIAYFCFRHENVEKEEFYMNTAKAALECGTIENHLQELSDAWYTLGLLFSLKECFTESENCYKKAISLNIKAYGPCHPRLYRLYDKLGDLYRINGKLILALDCFKKCKEIGDEGNFDKNKTNDSELKISEILDLLGNSIQLTEVDDIP